MPEDKKIEGRDLSLAVPIIGSTIALCYDVGYFTGADINLFTVFSVSEHISFAFEVLPLALMASVLLIIVPIAWDKSAMSALMAVQDGKITGRKRRFYQRKTFWLLTAFLMWNIVLAAYQRTFSSYVSLGSFLLFLILGNWFAVYLRRPVILGTALFITFSAYAFSFGVDIAVSYRNSNRYSYTIKTNDAEIRAKVVRSGERGVLFYVYQSNDLVLLPWSEIRKLSSDAVKVP